VIVDDFGQASKWLSSLGIYSFLLSNVLAPKLHENHFGQNYQQFFQAQLFLCQYNIDRIIIEKVDKNRELIEAAFRASGGQIEKTNFDTYLSLSRPQRAEQQGLINKQMNAAAYALTKACKDSTRSFYLFLKALIETLICLLLLLLTMPLLAVLLLLQSGKITSRAILGKANKRLYIHIFENNDLGSGKLTIWWWLPTLWNVCKGDLSLIGPRMILLAAEDNCHSNLYYQQAPGLISRSQLKANGLSTAQLDELDQAYMHAYSPILDLKIMLLAASKLLRI